MTHLERPMAVQSLPLPDGDAGTEATIAAMRRLIDEGKKDPVVHELAASILRKARVPAFDWAGEVRAIYQAVRRNVRFTRDIRGKETLHAAAEIIRLRIGDCDDFTILLCSLLETIGQKTRIVTVAGDERVPDTFTHVFPEVYLDGRWVSVDAARRKPALGKAPSHSFRTRFWDTNSPDFAEVAGLAGPGNLLRPGYVPRAWSRSTPVAFRALSGVRRRRGLAGMGDFNWSALSTAIQAGTTGAANIITAERASPYNLVPTTSTVPGTGYPASALYPNSLLSPSGTILGIPTGTFLIGALVIGAIALVAGRR